MTRKAATAVDVLRVHAHVPDASLLEALAAGHAWGAHEIWHRYAPHARRILLRIVGPRNEVDDLLHDVFVQAFRNAHTLRDPSALKGWLSIIAVHAARRWLRTRRRWRWLTFWSDDATDSVQAPVADESVREAVRALERILERMSVDERVAFVLRHVDGMELTEVAAACEVSLATLKRRLQRAEIFVRTQAAHDERLTACLQGGNAWIRR